MTLIKSISGIRGTMGGEVGDALTPPDVVAFASSYARFIRERSGKSRPCVVVGRDARLSGPMVQDLVMATLRMSGVDIKDAGLSTTPTVEMGVILEKADGGIILTASHNPKEWNALKLLNEKGEFLSGDDGKVILQFAENNQYSFSDVDNLGAYSVLDDLLDRHIQAILDLPYVDKEAISKANFKVAVDAVNSSGGFAIPAMLRALGVNDIVELYCEPTGHFPHNPEPLAEHLTEIMSTTINNKCDLGIVVDPDVDRLAFIMDNGEMFGEEYTLVACADYLLPIKGGNTVSNLSSSRALRDITQQHGFKYSASAVGEVNVVTEMKKTEASIGGEGNGGIILPDLHYGRDALVGVALALSHMALTGKKLSELRASYPDYKMLKQKIELQADLDVDTLLNKVAESFQEEEVSTIDGVKVDFKEGWVHLRKSNTEPILRVYAEGRTLESAQKLVDRMRKVISE
jgi:phosphomannomutase